MIWGYASSEHYAAVVPFFSESRSDVAARYLESCASSSIGIEFFDLEIVETGTDQEHIIERAELYARDQVTGCDGCEIGYTFYDVIEVSKPDDISSAAISVVKSATPKASKTSAVLIFNAFCGVEEAEDVEEFAAWINSKQKYMRLA